MFYISYDFGKRITDLRVAEVLQQAESRRLLREAGIARQGCWLLCQLGRFLIKVGHRLERHGLSQTISLERQMSGRRSNVS